DLGGFEVPDLVDERRLQPAEAEVEARVLAHRDRKLERFRVAALGRLLNRRPARIAEPEQAGSLVEGLAGRIVERFPQGLERSPLPDPGEQRVAAACDQAEEGR